jgi:hypothetical protein
MKAEGSAKKEKGRRLELKFAKMLRKINGLAKRMPLSGADWAFKSDIYTKLPYHFECKHQEKMKFWQWWEQTEDSCSMNKTPVLVHTANYRPVMVSLKAEDFISILKEIYEGNVS